MNLRDARKHILAQAAAGNAVLIRSGSGIGKSALAESIVEDVRRLNPGKSVGYTRFIAGLHNPVDVIGLPWKGTHTFALADGTSRQITVTDPSVPLWMISTEGKPAFCYDVFVIFFDEVGKADLDVQKPIYEIASTGGVPPWHAGNSVRILATNIGARYGETKRLDYLISRVSEVTVHGDTDIWVDDFADRPYRFNGREWMVMPVIKAWAKANPTILFEPEPEKQGPWCSPRQLTAVDRYLQVLSDGDPGNIQLSDANVIEMVSGTIGMGATQSLINHLQFRLELPSYEEIVDDPQNTAVPQRADLKLLMAYELAGRVKPDHVGQALAYMMRLPKDMSMTFATSLLRRDYKNVLNHPAMSAYISRNAAMIAVCDALSK